MNIQKDKSVKISISLPLNMPNYKIHHSIFPLKKTDQFIDEKKTSRESLLWKNIQ
jgi:hypothetical protein